MADRRPARRSEAGAARQAPPGACLLVPPGLAPHRSVMNMSPIRLAMLPAANRPPLPVPPRPAQRQAGAAPAWRVSDAAGPGRARPCRLLRREGLPPGGKIPRTTTATAAIVGRARRQRLYHGPLRLNAGPRPSEPDAVAVQRLCQDPMHLYGAPAPAQPAAAGTRKSRQDPMHLHGALAPRAAAAADETRSFRQNSMHQYGVLGPAEPSAAGIRNFRQDPMHLYGGGVRPSPHSLNSRKSATTPYARSSACPTPTRRHAGVTSPQPRATSCPP